MQDLEFVVQQAEDSGVDVGPIPDDTMANATLMGTEVKDTIFPGESEPTTRMRWKFRIDDDEYLDRYVWGSSGVKVVNHPHCKIYTWAQALLGIEPLPLDYRFTQQDLWQRRCRVLIGSREGKDKKTGEAKIFNYVEDVLPVGSSGPPTYVPAGAATDEEPF
jgi:hypothetical protein